MNHIGRRVRPGFRKAWGVLLFMALGLMSFAAEALASAGGKPATKLVNVADSRGLGSGITLWVADIYNGNFWLYGLTVVIVMAGMGAALGLVFDKLIGLLGIKFDKLDHHE